MIKKVSNLCNKATIGYLGILFAFAALILIKILFFNEFSADDACFSDVSLSILKGKVASSFYGNFLESSKYFFAYPPLHAIFTAAIFKILGSTYLTSKFTSIFFSVLLALIITAYCYRKFNTSVGILILSLILFDPLLFGTTYNNRPDIAATLFFTMAAILFIEGENRKSLKFLLFSGLLSGLALLTSYNCSWLFIAFSFYVLYSIYTVRLREGFKGILIYLFSSFIILVPWFSWIIFDKARRSIFFAQIIGSTSSVEGYSFNHIIRKLLNPIADLYLAITQHHSPFSIIAFLIFLYLLFNFKKYAYQFFLLCACFLMMLFNLRAAHYFAIILPFCYLQFGHMIIDPLLKLDSNVKLKRLAYALMTLTIFIGLFYDSQLLFKESNIKLDSSYYSSVLTKNTPDGSRIATDPVFVFANRGNRKIINVGLLIWEFIRKSYASYDDIVTKVVDADYIILTEREKKWGESPINQSIEFQKYLKEHCLLLKLVDDNIHGPIWIYKTDKRI